VRAKSPEWYMGVLRLSELGSVLPVEAAWLNGLEPRLRVWLRIDRTP
jgi:hypothetical protein